jgi:hypothetical protein
LDSRAIWYKPIDRDELINFIDRETNASVPALEAYDFTDIRFASEGITAYWQDDPRHRATLPTGIIIPSGRLEDFFAWIATYVPVRPFTAYCRVLDRKVIQYLSNRKQISFIPLENCFLGMILAECAKDTGNVERASQLSLIDSASTLSFCLTRAVALGIADAAEWIEGQWTKVRSLIPDRRNLGDTSLVLRVFTLVCALDGVKLLSEEDEIILRCAREIAESGEIRQDSWFALTNWNPQLVRWLDIHRLPREGRIELLRRAADSIRGEKDPRAAFVIGYLASAIAPGTFDHYRTVLEFEPKFEGALLWYGFCAGLYRGSDLQFFANGLGRRIARELERADSIYSRPYCDVAISELEVLVRAPRPLDFRLGSPNTIEVELAPCVTTLRTFGSKQQIRNPENIDALLRELDNKLLDLNRLRGRIANATLNVEQSDLYGESPRGRKK